MRVLGPVGGGPMSRLTHLVPYCSLLGGNEVAGVGKGGDMTKILGIRHAVLAVRDPQRSITFYTKFLGMELVTFLEDMQMAFLSFGERDHDLALIKVPDDQPVGSSGLAHIAFEIDGGPEQLQELHARLKARGLDMEMTFDHVMTQSIYFLDPDGNRFELFSQVMPRSEAKRYLHGAAFRAMCCGRWTLRRSPDSSPRPRHRGQVERPVGRCLGKLPRNLCAMATRHAERMESRGRGSQAAAAHRSSDLRTAVRTPGPWR